MNPKSLKEAKLLFNKVKNTGAIICPPAVYISVLRPNGSQDCFWEDLGPFTGETSPAMLRNLGVEYVILGHSERRRWLGETEEMINKKLKAALSAGLKPILCVEKISQIPQNAENLIIVFEPSSAISGGGAYHPYPVNEAKKMRRSLASFPLVLYGGSVNSQNAKNYINEAGFQGLLVGKASLDSREFLEIVKAIC